MCQRVTCSSCGKPTFVGCGLHVEAVLADVPPADRCQCRAAAGEGSASEPPPAKGWLRSLFGGGESKGS